MVTHIQMWVGCGPVQCQNRSGGIATNCMWEYVFRMVFVNLWTKYTQGVYCKMRGSKEHTQAFLVSLRFLCALAVCLFAFSHVPDGEWILAVALGRERTARATLSVFALGALQAGVDLRRIIRAHRGSEFQNTDLRNEVALPSALGRRMPAKRAISSVSSSHNHLRGIGHLVRMLNSFSC